MKKITILVSAPEVNRTLKALRKAGVVHVKNVQKAKGEDIDFLEDKLQQLEKALAILPEGSKGEEKILGREKIYSVIEDIISVKEKQEKLDLKKEELRQDINLFKLWGDVEPLSLEQLKRQGVFVKLYICGRRDLKHLPSDKIIRIIREQKKRIYFALVTTDKKDKLPFPEIELPEENLTSLKAKLETIQEELDEIEYKLLRLAKYKRYLSNYKKELAKELEFYRIREGMGKEEGFAYLQGFCPKEWIPKISSLAKKESWALLTQEPDNPEEVPTLIKNPPWIKIIKPVFKFMGTLPGYNEYDVSIWFLVFLSLFFAMLVGDAGYGIIFLLASIFFHRKFSQLQQKKEAVFLMYVFSGVTIIWGTVTGTWFGLEKVAQLPFFNYFVIDKINSFVSSNQSFLMYICFLLGVIHLSIGHAIVGFRYINSLFALSQLGWISILWGLFFIIRKLIIGISLPGFTLSLLIGGVGLVIFFSSPQRNILKGIAKGIGKIPLKTINSFSDIVSYVRLFAVGYATVAVASSFNDMALSIGGGNILKGFIAALVLFLGHSLNILLALMAVIVHGIRLNMLEFSNHAGIEWKGYEYRPFSNEG